MARFRTIATHLTAILLLSGSSATWTPITTGVVFDTQDPAQLEMAEWAIERFADAGLELPPLLIRFPGLESSLCDGIQGRSFLSQDPVEVRMCWEDEFILLHELAHVWESNSFPVAKRQSFIDMRLGVESWSSNDVVWGARGREHAANVIAWGLLEDPYPISTTYPNDVASMTEAFSFLTGVELLHDGGDGIRHPERSWFERTGAPPLELGR